MHHVEISEVKKTNSGAVDGPDIFLACVGCERKLVHLKVIHPDAPATWNIRADCPCGERSVFHHVVGGFRHAPCDGFYIEDLQINKYEMIYKMGEVVNEDE